MKIQVDKVFTISLIDQEERREITKKEINKLGLEPNWFLTEREASGNPEKGCFDSHVSIANLALKNNYNHILVFEDDVKILAYSEKQLIAINHFIQNHINDFDLLYLGFILGKIWYCGKKNIVRAKGVTSHAYILSPSGIKKMANFHYQGNPIDEIMKENMKCYSVYPLIAAQQSETLFKSSISEERNKKNRHAVKDDGYWEKNFKKQKKRLYQNIPLSILEISKLIYKKSRRFLFNHH